MIDDIYGVLIFAAAFVLWGTVGALECNTIDFTQFWIQIIVCAAVIWLGMRVILRKNR